MLTMIHAAGKKWLFDDCHSWFIITRMNAQITVGKLQGDEKGWVTWYFLNEMKLRWNTWNIMKRGSKALLHFSTFKQSSKRKHKKVSYQTLEHGNLLKSHVKKQKKRKLKYIFKSAKCHLLHLTLACSTRHGFGVVSNRVDFSQNTCMSIKHLSQCASQNWHTPKVSW